MKKLCIFSLVMVAVYCASSIGTLIPPPDKLTMESGKCLVDAKHKFAIIRASISTGEVDPGLAENFKAATASGMPEIEFSVSPCVPCDPVDQAKKTIEAIKGYPAKRIWVNIKVPGWREFKDFNRGYLEDLLKEFEKAGKRVGVIAAKFQWEEFFGADYSGGAKYDLMYEALDKKPSFKGFRKFGGWKKPVAKHYESGATVCSMKMEMVYREDSAYSEW